MKVIMQARAGEPLDALELVDIPEAGALGDGEVLVDVQLASLHFGDFFYIRSFYAKPRTDAPARVGESSFGRSSAGDPEADIAVRRGSEAYGVVAAVGPNVPDSIRVGGRVATIAAQGAWGEKLVAPASCVIPVPDALPGETVAQLFVNAIAALMVFRDIRRSVSDAALREGAVILTGAGTAVARILARLLVDAGVSVIGLTRSNEGAAQARARAPDVAFVSTKAAGWQAGVRAAAVGRPIVAIADCVSGPLIGEVAELLRDDGLISVYGGLSPEPPGLSGLQIASRGLEIRGVTIGRWFTAATEAMRQADIAAAIELGLRHPELFPVAARVPLENFRDAVALLERPGRDGGVMLEMRTQP